MANKRKYLVQTKLIEVDVDESGSYIEVGILESGDVEELFDTYDDAYVKWVKITY